MSEFDFEDGIEAPDEKERLLPGDQFDSQREAAAKNRPAFAPLNYEKPEAKGEETECIARVAAC